jgi:pimeloyl-ACP methyl ester carboxylesterase
VQRETLRIPSSDHPFEAWMVRPARRRARGALLVVPGLHFLGPADPRLERLLAILADAGYVVVAPFLRDFMALRLDSRVIDDLDRAWTTLRESRHLPDGVRPGIFSISFGSLPALRVAADPRRASEVGGLMVFGGYADWRNTLRFCLQGATGYPHDPLNRPVAFINLLEHIEDFPADKTLVDAWLKYVRTTWGRPEMKRRDRHEPIARHIASELPAHLRTPFLIGCGLGPGSDQRCLDAMQRAAHWDALLDPRPRLHGLRCPVHLVHGVDDDVIPHTELDALYQALPSHVPATRHVTGLYGHSGRGGALAGAASLARELGTMAAMLRGLARIGTTW